MIIDWTGQKYYVAGSLIITDARVWIRTILLNYYFSCPVNVRCIDNLPIDIVIGLLSKIESGINIDTGVISGQIEKVKIELTNN